MQPLKIKASGSPPSSTNFQGLQEMTDTEINQYLSYVITNKFANDSDGTGTAELNVSTNNATYSGTSIGNFLDTVRTESIGTHPATGSTTTTTYYFKQVTSAASESITNRPVGWDSAVKEFTDGQLDTDLLDKVIEDMVTESSYTVGQYKLSASAPTGGTWTSRFTITDSHLDGSNTIYLWQKTTPTSSANTDLTSLKVNTSSDLKMMTASEIEQMVPNFRNRIISSGIGTYVIQSSAPGTGTWIQMGDSFDDTRHIISPEAYAGPYAGGYVGTSTYSGSASYTGVASYAGTAAYAGTYSGTYTGAYTLTYLGYSGSDIYAGAYVGFFTGYYTGAASYTGPAEYVGIGGYVGPKTYSGSYTGSYTGDTVQASIETVSTIKLWLRTA